MRTLLVFLKYPTVGHVKTRLAESIGHQRAADLYHDWVGIVLANVQRIRRSTRLVACFDGAPQDEFSFWHPLADNWWRQPDRGLGDRLGAAFRCWHASGGPVIAIGTDCLEVDAESIEAAFDILGEKDAVFGPAADGGYYLVGLTRYLPGFFHHIPWSTPTTLAAHQSACERQGWSFGLLPTLRDIDTLEDWKDYQQRKSNQA